MVSDKKPTRSRSSELLADLGDQLSEILRETKLPEATIEKAKKTMLERITHHWGGQLLYFPLNLGMKLSERDRMLFEDFNGRNHASLARKYSVSLKTVYKILARYRNQDPATNRSKTSFSKTFS